MPSRFRLTCESNRRYLAVRRIGAYTQGRRLNLWPTQKRQSHARIGTFRIVKFTRPARALSRSGRYFIFIFFSPAYQRNIGSYTDKKRRAMRNECFLFLRRRSNKQGPRQQAGHRPLALASLEQTHRLNRPRAT